MAGVALRGGQRGIDRQTVFAGQMRDDRATVADGLAVVDDVGKLPARRARGIEYMMMRERQAG